MQKYLSKERNRGDEFKTVGTRNDKTIKHEKREKNGLSSYLGQMFSLKMNRRRKRNFTIYGRSC